MSSKLSSVIGRCGSCRLYCLALIGQNKDALRSPAGLSRVSHLRICPCTSVQRLKGTLLSDNVWYKQYWMSYSISVVFRQKWNIERGLSWSQSWSLLTYCIYTKSLACVWVKKSVFFLTNHIPAWHPVINNKPDVARRYFWKKQIKLYTEQGIF